MEIVVYTCLNCGKKFYFYGEVAMAMMSYWASSGVLRDIGYVQAPIINHILNLQAKCCNCPIISLDIS